MRIHNLEVTAFGPFSDPVAIDFDALSTAGLFLLCGPTGAGKTSVLDAICFGIYGEVPGDRNSAKRLRSDHAAPGVAPVVLLEVSINARRFRIRRSPAWSRPKRRGTGATSEHAKVNLEEKVEGLWVHHSNRLDEAGHQMTELLGMNVSEFCQVAMLPQGRFQSFLRAKSGDRHKVLQQLFRTSRFEDVERWLVGRRQSLRVANRTHQEKVVSVVSRISESAAADVPAAWDLHDLAFPAAEGHVALWAAELHDATTASGTEIDTEVRQAARCVADARARLTDASRVLDLHAKHEEATRLEESLHESLADADEARARLDAARRATAVSPLLRVAGDSAAAAEAAQRRLGHVLADAARRLRADALDLTDDGLATAERSALVAATTARVLLPREAELRSAQQTVEAVTAELAGMAAVASRLRERCELIPAEVARLRPVLAEQTVLASEVTVVDQRESLVLTQLAAADRLDALRRGLETAHARELASVAVAHDLRERMHDIREARINGMAAELAAVLASGDSCPVCGSAEHPAVAGAVEGAPTKADEAAARSAYEDADFTRQTCSETVADLEKSCALTDQSAAGKSADSLRAELEEVRDARAACQEAAASRTRLETTIESLGDELAAARDNLAEVTTRAARLTKDRDHAHGVAQKVFAQIAALFEDEEVDDSIERLIEEKASAGAAFAEARVALTERDTAMARSREARSQAQDCAAEHGFGTCEAAASAVLRPSDIKGLEGLLHERATLHSRAVTVLSDEEVQAAVAVPASDIDELKVTVRLAEDALAGCAARLRVIGNRKERLVLLGAELGAELAAWAPTRSAYSVAEPISAFVEGKGGDNSLQMRLSAYVLAERLTQVVAAANERLSTMSDQRYLLEHSSARGVGEVRGGLSLLVRDEWTGESRDPATLSGGETFVVSLALALGLADVVTREAGGSNIDTLFIDEGFGSLDSDTLDDVMDTLDGLRGGGRVVGIVSHVPEMRTRVVTQLRIRKERSGSSVAAAREAV
jgi:exonuclease SbcC